jgi:hypothetical protein
MSVSQLRDGFFDLAERLYNDEFTRWRRENCLCRASGRADLPRLNVA